MQIKSFNVITDLNNYFLLLYININISITSYKVITVIYFF